jgi:hypothetical protein
MFTSILVAAEVADEVTSSQAGGVLELGGLILLLTSMGCILMGVAQGGDERSGGGRLLGYGVAMAAAAGIALYTSTSMGGDPLATATGASWMYPLLAIIGCLLYASRLINSSKHRYHAQKHIAQRDAYGRRPDVRGAKLARSRR